MGEIDTATIRRFINRPDVQPPHRCELCSAGYPCDRSYEIMDRRRADAEYVGDVAGGWYGRLGDAGFVPALVGVLCDALDATEPVPCSHGHLCMSDDEEHFHMVPTESCPPCQAIRGFLERQR